ncbi:MAG: hypothetical protein RIC95_10230 [Vicingaceae bacterium]
MILIADSGSTKTDWRFLRNSTDIQAFESKGLNPTFHSEDSILEVLHATFKDQNLEVQQIFFYGAGCASEARKELVKAALSQQFPKAKIEVEHDLLGSARAACGHGAGLAGILGTGSNCCVYDGKNITDSFPSGGFSISDEGGGVKLGRRLLKAYIEEYLPQDLKKSFDLRYKIEVDEILENLYKKPYPNRYMAAFSRFVYHHREHPFTAELIQEEFRAFFDHKVLRFEAAKTLPLSLVGSVAFYYHEFIKAVAQEKGIGMGTILEKPISGLSLYHQELLTN